MLDRLRRKKKEVPEGCIEITTEISYEYLEYLKQCQAEYEAQLGRPVTLGETIEQVFNEMATELGNYIKGDKRNEYNEDYEGYNPAPLQEDDPMYG